MATSRVAKRGACNEKGRSNAPAHTREVPVKVLAGDERRPKPPSAADTRNMEDWVSRVERSLGLGVKGRRYGHQSSER